MFKLSWNPLIIDKPNKGMNVPFATGFISGEVTTDEFIELILNGYGVTAQFKDNHRKSRNFLCSNFIAVDVDSGLSLDEAIENDFVKRFSSFIYTTPSHTEEDHRFRIVFETPELITDETKWKKALQGIGRKFGGDPAIKDAARLFFGCRNAKIYRFDKMLTSIAFEEILHLSYSKIPSNADNSNISYVTSLKITVDEKVRTVDNVVVPLNELKTSTSIYCPIHIDQNPSAFVVESKGGVKGVHCSACNATFWSQSQPKFQFNAVDDFIEKRQGEEGIVIEQLDTRYLPSISYSKGTVFVKSPKGSGKTAALIELVKFIKSNTNPRKFPDQPRSVLLIGHRQNLLREACNKLGLACYLDSSPTKFFGICLDSLGRRLNRSSGFPPYDVVIIDESEQVFSHLTSETINQRSNGLDICFEHLKYFIRQAKSVIALDADLDIITLTSMRVLRPYDWLNQCRVISNKPKITTNMTIQMYGSKGHLYSDVLSAIQRGEKCFITSNSKKMIDDIEIDLKGFKNCKYIKITSDNSQDDETIDFMNSIAYTARELDVIIASPSLGTGVDITFPNNEIVFQNVYGFFEPFINTHTDIDQQLARVRHASNIKVYINPRNYEVETDVNVILENLGRAFISPKATYISDDGHFHITREDPLLQIYSQVLAYQNASKSHILKNFIDLKKEQGCEILWIDKDENKNSSGNKKLQESKHERVENSIDEFLKAKPIDQNKFYEIYAKRLKGERVSPREQIEFERAFFERAFSRQIDRTLAKKILEKNFLEKLTTIHQIVNNSWIERIESWSVDFVRTEEFKVSYLRSMPKHILIEVIMCLCGFVKVGKLNLRKQVSHADLKPFISFSEDNNIMIGKILGRPLRKDVKERPMMTLNNILGEAGLTLKKLKSKKSKGMVSNFYGFSRSDLDLIERYLSEFKPVTKEQIFEETECVTEDGKLDYRKFYGLYSPIATKRAD